MGHQLDLFAPRAPRPQPQPIAQPSSVEPESTPAHSAAVEYPTDAGTLLRLLRQSEAALREAQRRAATTAELAALEAEHQGVRRLHLSAFERLRSRSAVIAALFDAFGSAPSAELIESYDHVRRAFVVRQPLVQSSA